MARLNVNPTRQELRRLRERLKTSVRGHKLLKDKTDEMIRQFCILIRKNKKLREEVEADLAGALKNFSSAKAVMDERALEEAFLLPAASVSLTCGERSVMSVAVPDIEVHEETRGNAPYAYATVSSEVDHSVSALAAILPKLVRLASVEKTCNLLANEIEKTKRRVNALEYVLIPQYEETIRYIMMKLDENERGATTRLMKVKDMLAAAREG